MIQVYADTVLAYDNRLEELGLLDLSVTLALNKGGTAELTMPPSHPAYDAFTSYRTLVRVYKDNELLFRGRALYPSDDFYNRRTVTCEGERCFLRDGVMRPYVYQDSPAAIFESVITLYNAQVDDYKRFAVGTVTVADPNTEISLESENAEQVLDVVDKLVERCGGYIVFTTNANGDRVINWLEQLDSTSEQVIEFGSNLLDFARTAQNADLATVIVPLGARDAETGVRLGIESVNNGEDRIQDAEAVALRGVIARPVVWDDITEAENLLAMAQQYLASSKLMVTSLELTAVDLSEIDKTIDTLRVGDTIRVRSKPHDVDSEFMLQTRVYDLLDAAKGKVTLGKTASTLSAASAAGDRQNNSEIQRVTRSIQANAERSAAATLSSMSQQSGCWRIRNGPLIQWGVVEITPTTLNEPASATVTFLHEYDTLPVIQVTPVTDAPQSVSVGVSAVSNSAAVVQVTRTVNLAGTDIYWLAIGSG